mmetsp:Transcript_119191/g.381954  ORF Transcript_119191/g.381954 Transcript_119191/m.381954 type:complete len:256 (+) Transcript_119191:1174-1941(+)
MIPHEEHLVGGVILLLREHAQRSLSIEGLGRLDDQRGVSLRFRAIRVEWWWQREILLVAQPADAELGEELLDALHVVLRIHRPKGIDLATCRLHNPLQAAWMDLDELGDVVHAFFVRDPDTNFRRVVFLHLGESDDLFARLCARAELPLWHTAPLLPLNACSPLACQWPARAQSDSNRRSRCSRRERRPKKRRRSQRRRRRRQCWRWPSSSQCGGAGPGCEATSKAGRLQRPHHASERASQSHCGRARCESEAGR